MLLQRESNFIMTISAWDYILAGIAQWLWCMGRSHKFGGIGEFANVDMDDTMEDVLNKAASDRRMRIAVHASASDESGLICHTKREKANWIFIALKRSAQMVIIRHHSYQRNNLFTYQASQKNINCALDLPNYLWTEGFHGLTSNWNKYW